MNGTHPHRGDAMERIEGLRNALRASAHNARQAIDATRRFQVSENARCTAAMQHIERANRALHASVGLIG